MRARTFIPVLAAMALVTATPHTAAAQDNDSEPDQSIQVHGHWIIEVYDGEELVERQEFDNALAPAGPIVLANILTAQDTITVPGAVIYDTLSQPLEGITEAEGDTVSLSTPATGDDAGKIILSGSYVLESAHAIGAVAYAVFTRNGLEWLHELVTLKEFATPIEVAGNQTVNVTVTISFSG